MRRNQVAVLATTLDGVLCDIDGTRLANASDASCVLFDSLEDARAFGRQTIERHPGLRLEVFDATGRANPPLLTIVHPAHDLEASPRAMRRRRDWGVALVAGAVVMIAAAFWFLPAIWTVVLMLLGGNALLAGGRLLLVNVGVRESEALRLRRIEERTAVSAELRQP